MVFTSCTPAELILTEDKLLILHWLRIECTPLSKEEEKGQIYCSQYKSLEFLEVLEKVLWDLDLIIKYLLF